MPGVHYPDPPVLSTSSIGHPSYGSCSSSISTSPSPFFGCEEVEFDDSGLAGYSTSEGSPTCASSQSSPYGGDGPAEPVITSYRSPTSLPGSSGLAGFTPPTNGNLLSTLRSSDRTGHAESATLGGYSTSPSPGCSGSGYFALSPGSSYSSSELSSLPSSELSSLLSSELSSLPSSELSSLLSSELSSLPSSELSSLPSSELSSLLPSPSSPLASTSSSGFFPGLTASADLPRTQDNNTLQSSSKRGFKLDTKGANMPEALSGNPVLSKSTQGRALAKYTRMPNRSHLSRKTGEYREDFPVKLMPGMASVSPGPHWYYNALTGR